MYTRRNAIEGCRCGCQPSRDSQGNEGYSKVLDFERYLRVESRIGCGWDEPSPTEPRKLMPLWMNQICSVLNSEEGVEVGENDAPTFRFCVSLHNSARHLRLSPMLEYMSCERCGYLNCQQSCASKGDTVVPGGNEGQGLHLVDY